MRVVDFAAPWGASVILFTRAALPIALVTGTAWGQESRLEGLRAAASVNRGDPATALAYGRALRRAGHLPEATAQLRMAASLASKPAEQTAAYVELAHDYADAKDFAQALATCKRLEHVSGALAEAHACAASAQFIRQRASEALVETTLALGADPRSYDAKVAEGRAYELELDTSRAQAALREAIAIDDGPADAHLVLGRVLLKSDRRDDGIVELRSAVARDPLEPDGIFELASALGAVPEGLALLERAVHERPSFSAAWLGIGVQRLAAGQVAQAGEAGRAALRNDPSNMRARVLLGQVSLAEGRTDEAIRAGEAVLKVVANDAAAQLLVADGNAKVGEIDRALEAYQAAWGLDHSAPTPLVNASVACHRAGRDTSARAFGERATQEFPAWAPAWVALGDALAAQGEGALARNAYAKALAATSGTIDREAVLRKIAAR